LSIVNLEGLTPIGYATEKLLMHLNLTNEISTVFLLLTLYFVGGRS